MAVAPNSGRAILAPNLLKPGCTYPAWMYHRGPKTTADRGVPDSAIYWVAQRLDDRVGSVLLYASW